MKFKSLLFGTLGLLAYIGVQAQEGPKVTQNVECAGAYFGTGQIEFREDKSDSTIFQGVISANCLVDKIETSWNINEEDSLLNLTYKPIQKEDVTALCDCAYRLSWAIPATIRKEYVGFTIAFIKEE